MNYIYLLPIMTPIVLIIGFLHSRYYLYKAYKKSVITTGLKNFIVKDQSHIFKNYKCINCKLKIVDSKNYKFFFKHFYTDYHSMLKDSWMFNRYMSKFKFASNSNEVNISCDDMIVRNIIE